MAATTTDRRAELARLVFRLEDGFDKIAEAAAKGLDTTRWTTVWIQLLEQYEALYDELETAPTALSQPLPDAAQPMLANGRRA